MLGKIIFVMMMLVWFAIGIFSLVYPFVSAGGPHPLWMACIIWYVGILVILSGIYIVKEEL